MLQIKISSAKQRQRKQNAKEKYLMATWEDLDSFNSKVEKTYIRLMIDVCNSSDDYNEQEVDFFFILT